MYLMQIVAYHRGTGCCGGSDERTVVQSLSDANRQSFQVSQFMVDIAVARGELIRRRCYC